MSVCLQFSHVSLWGVYVCVHMYMYLCICVLYVLLCVHVSIHRYANVCWFLCMGIHVCMRVCVCCGCMCTWVSR